MIQSLTVDVAALQRLSESDPLPRYAEFGLCFGGTCGAGTCGLLLASCVALAITCGIGSFVSPE